MTVNISNKVKTKTGNFNTVEHIQQQSTTCHEEATGAVSQKEILFEQKPHISEETKMSSTFEEAAYSTSSVIASVSNGSTSDTITGLASTSKQKLKIKLKKNKIKLSEKFQWFQNYFRNDPVDFCENFVQQTTAMRRNSTCSIASRSHKLYSSSTPPPLGCFQKLSCSPSLPQSSILINLTELTAPPGTTTITTMLHEVPSVEVRSSALSAPSTSTTSVATVDNFDFYSSICDKQLSFNNSPCKSPRSLVDLALLGSSNSHNSNRFNCSAELRNFSNRRNTIVVAAKPAKEQAIGFNVQSITHKTTTVSSIDNCLDEEIANVAGGTNFYVDAASTISDTAQNSAFVFQHMSNALNNCQQLHADNVPAPKETFNTSASADTKGWNRNKNSHGAILNLIIIKDVKSVPPEIGAYEYIEPDDTADDSIEASTKQSLRKHIKCSGGGGVLISAGSTDNSSSSGFCTSEYCTNSSGSSCSCNPFSLDLERHNIVRQKQSTIDESNENLQSECNKNV